MLLQEGSLRIAIVITLLAVTVIPTKNIRSQIRIKAVGDVMLGSVTPKRILPPDNGFEFAESVSGYLKNADIVFGNLEGSFITDSLLPVKCKEKSRKAGTCYEFGMPEDLATVLPDIGFTVMSLDNNHSEDYGHDGYELTRNLLFNYGIKPAGKKEYSIIPVKSDSVCIVAFGYSENSFKITELESAREIIQKLDSVFNIIIVSFHGGAEGKNASHIKDTTEIFLGENRGNVMAFARSVIDAGADLVIGHGPHVLRAFEIYKNKFIAYSLGNFLTYGNMNISGTTGISGILDVRIDRANGEFMWGNFISTIQAGRGIPQIDESNAGLSAVQELSFSDIVDSKIFFSSKGFFFNKFIDAEIRQEGFPPDYFQHSISDKRAAIK